MTATDQRIIVLAVNNSKHSENALNWIVSNVLSENDIVHLLTVITPPNEPAYYLDTNASRHAREYIEDLKNGAVKEAKELLSKFQKFINAGLECKVEGHVAFGDRREQVVEYSRTHKCDLLVLGSRGLGTFKRHLLGSVSNYCMHHAHCPVLLIKNEKK